MLRSTMLFFVYLVFSVKGVISAPYAGPVIDAHNHWNGSRDVNEVAELMRSNNIVAVVMMPRAYGSRDNKADLPTDDESALKELEKFPNLFLPTIGMQLPQLTSANWNSPNAFMLQLYDSVEQKLKSGDYFGIGEVIIRHYPYHNHPTVAETGKHMDIQQSPNSVHFRKLAELAGRHQRPIIFHMEGEPTLVYDLTIVLKEFPKTQFIWSHMCGRISPEKLTELLDNHENLICDLAAMVNVGPTGYGFSKGKDYPDRIGWPRAFPWTHIIEEDGIFFPEVKDLILKFPERFLGVGMDNAHGSLPNRAFRDRLKRFRELLGDLPQHIARKLACDNARQLWNLKLSCNA